MKTISRRTFVTTAAKLGIAGWATDPLLRSLAAETQPPSRAWQLGCYTRPFDQFDYRTALDGIAEAGFRYVGLLTTNTKQWVMITPDTPPDEVASMHQEARKRNLKVLSIYGDFSAGDSVELGTQRLKKLIDHCRRCDCPNLLLGGTSDEKIYQAYYRAIAESCDYAATKGVLMSIKPHGGQNATGAQCRKAIDLVGRKNFGLWYDPGNIFYYSDGQLDPVQDAATVDGLVVGMSVKDFRLPKEVLLDPGTGKVNFSAVMARLKQGGFNHGPLLLECLERGPIEKVKAAAKKARELMEELTGQKA